MSFNLDSIDPLPAFTYLDIVLYARNTDPIAATKSAIGAEIAPITVLRPPDKAPTILIPAIRDLIPPPIATISLTKKPSNFITTPKLLMANAPNTTPNIPNFSLTQPIARATLSMTYAKF
jgi:hypothetical protein